MKAIQIELRSEDCRDCPCMDKTKNDAGEVYYLCPAFHRTLNIKVNGVGGVIGVKRCEECNASEVEVADEQKAAEETVQEEVRKES